MPEPGPAITMGSFDPKEGCAVDGRRRSLGCDRGWPRAANPFSGAKYPRWQMFFRHGRARVAVPTHLGESKRGSKTNEPHRRQSTPQPPAAPGPDARLRRRRWGFRRAVLSVGEVAARASVSLRDKPPGPALRTPKPALAAALSCPQGVRGGRDPVLLVPGSGGNPTAMRMRRNNDYPARAAG